MLIRRKLGRSRSDGAPPPVPWFQCGPHRPPRNSQFEDYGARLPPIGSSKCCLTHCRARFYFYLPYVRFFLAAASQSSMRDSRYRTSKMCSALSRTESASFLSILSHSGSRYRARNEGHALRERLDSKAGTRVPPAQRYRASSTSGWTARRLVVCGVARWTSRQRGYRSVRSFRRFVGIAQANVACTFGSSPLELSSHRSQVRRHSTGERRVHFRIVPSEVSSRRSFSIACTAAASALCRQRTNSGFDYGSPAFRCTGTRLSGDSIDHRGLEDIVCTGHSKFLRLLKLRYVHPRTGSSG